MSSNFEFIRWIEDLNYLRTSDNFYPTDRHFYPLDNTIQASCNATSTLDKIYPSDTDLYNRPLIAKRDKAYKSGKYELLLFYDEKVRPKQSAYLNSWWRQIKKIAGKKKYLVSILDPETGPVLDNKQSATLIDKSL